MSKKIFMILITISIITSYTLNNSIYVYASEDTVSYDSLSAYEKICVYLYYGLAEAGEIVSLDFNEAEDIHNEWVEFVNGTTYEKKLSEMTESEIQEILDNLIENLESKGCKCDSNGKVTLSDDFIKEFRSWLDTYMEENSTPLYYTVHIGKFEDISGSNCINTNTYNTIKNAIEKFNIIAVRYYNNHIIIYDLSQYETNDFCLYNSESVGIDNTKCYLATIYSKESEKRDYYIPTYDINVSTDNSIVTDFENDSRVNKLDQSILVYVNGVDFRNYNSQKWNISDKSYAYMLSKEDMYVKLFTNLANYQDYITNTASQNVYYTSNYFKTENIQQSPIGLDEMVKLYEAYDDLCKKIIQYVQDTSNATDTMIVNKLDELIKAVYSSSGSGSTDVDVSVDMTETNIILDKILKKLDDILQGIKTIGNIEIIDLGEDNPITEWTNNITNMVVNPEANIDATIGDISGSMDEPITLLKTKFPFSIPWDIAFLLEFLADSPETPKFEIPMKFESMNIDEKLTIDFSHFESVSKVSRMLLTLLFMVALMNLTTKVFNIGGASND